MTVRFGDDDFLRTWGAAWSADEPDELLALHTDDVIYEDTGSSLEFHGHDGLRRFFGWMLVFASDTVVDFTEAHGDGEVFAAKWVWSGTATGPLKVDDTIYPATNARFSVPGVAYCTLGPDGLIASHRDYYDMFAVLKQLGVARGAVAAD